MKHPEVMKPCVVHPMRTRLETVERGGRSVESKPQPPGSSQPLGSPGRTLHPRLPARLILSFPPSHVIAAVVMWKALRSLPSCVSR